MIRALGAVVGRPSLWPIALRQWGRLVPPGWWRRRPFLPVPAREYVAFRMLTQHGDSRAGVTGPDVVNYLRWCQDWP